MDLETAAEGADCVKLEAEPIEEVKCVIWLGQCIFLGCGCTLVSEEDRNGLWETKSHHGNVGELGFKSQLCRSIYNLGKVA